MLGNIARIALVIGLASTAAEANPALKVHPGLQVVQSMYDAHDSAGNFLGDYQWSSTVTEAANGGYTASFRQIGGAAGITGTMTVTPEDDATATMLHEYSHNGDNSTKGYVGWLRLSDATFKALASGQETK